MARGCAAASVLAWPLDGFVMQVRLADVPTLANDSGLLSFHYCETCMLDGHMAFGWSPSGGDTGAYAVNVMEPSGSGAADGLDVVAASFAPACRVRLASAVDVPTCDDFPESMEKWMPGPEDFGGSFEEWTAFRDGRAELALSLHIPTSKLGGWPTWAQERQWPVGSDGVEMVFVGQLDCDLGDGAAPWSDGGYAYLFVERAGLPGRTGEMVILTT